MPNHMDMPAPGAPVRTWGPKVSHRNAPGAISAMALLVSPVRPSVGRVVGVDSGTDFSFRAWEESRDFESAPDLRAESNCIGPNALSRIEVSQRQFRPCLIRVLVSCLRRSATANIWKTTVVRAV